MTRHPPSPLRGFGGTSPRSLLRSFGGASGEASGATDLSTVARAGADASEGGNITRLMAHRNAVRVLPLPVGARMRVDSPRAMAGQPSVCGGVGASKEARNHSATAGWKSSNTPARFATFTIVPRLFAPRFYSFPSDPS